MAFLLSHDIFFQFLWDKSLEDHLLKKSAFKTKKKNTVLGKKIKQWQNFTKFCQGKAFVYIILESFGYTQRLMQATWVTAYIGQDKKVNCNFVKLI